VIRRRGEEIFYLLSDYKLHKIEEWKRLFVWVNRMKCGQNQQHAFTNLLGCRQKATPIYHWHSTDS
jgi:hypothetical protein